MVRELDIDADEVVDPIFKESIQGITSQLILQKIQNRSPIENFYFDGFLENVDVNTARFLMEGLGFSAKYWLCTGVKTLHSLMIHNIEREPYSELIKQSGRKDVLCLNDLPLFYTHEGALEDCLLLVSDVKKRPVRIVSFMDTRKDMEANDLRQISKKRKKKVTIKDAYIYNGDPGYLASDDVGNFDNDNDIPF